MPMSTDALDPRPRAIATFHDHSPLTVVADPPGPPSFVVVALTVAVVVVVVLIGFATAALLAADTSCPRPSEGTAGPAAAVADGASCHTPSKQRPTHHGLVHSQVHHRQYHIRRCPRHYMQQPPFLLPACAIHEDQHLGVSRLGFVFSPEGFFLIYTHDLSAGKKGSQPGPRHVLDDAA